MNIENGNYQYEDFELFISDEYVEIEILDTPLSSSSQKLSILDLFIGLGKRVYISYSCSNWISKGLHSIDLKFLRSNNSDLIVKSIYTSRGYSVMVLKKSYE